MKTFILRIAVLWRRFRRLRARGAEHLRHAEQLAPLMKRANPFASWTERANWMIDVAAWIGRAPDVSQLDREAWTRIKQQRLRILLDWLDAERGVRRVVRASVQKTLREAGARELFAGAGLPRAAAPFSERLERLAARLVPKRLAANDMRGLLAALFPRPGDADWLLGLDAATLARLWKLCADPAIEHAYRVQLDDALLYLATAVAAAGLDPELALEEQACIPLQAMPFMVLRRELELWLLARPETSPGPRGVRMLTALCHTHLDRVAEQLERRGMSLAAACRIQDLRAQLGRMAILTDLRCAGAERHAGLQRLLLEALAGAPPRTSLYGLAARSALRVARKMVERGGPRYERPLGRGWRALAWPALIGGMVAGAGALAQLALARASLAPFFEGLFVAAQYAGCLTLLAALGGMLATRQPVEAGARLAASLTGPKPAPAARAAARQLADPARRHAAGMLGNLLGAAAAGLALAAVGAPLTPRQALAAIQGLSPFGPTVLFAAVTGALIWLACVAGEWADSWFAQRGMREALAQHRNAVRVLGPLRAARCAEWLERRVGTIAASLSLAVLIGMTPPAAQFFGLPFEVRHAVLSAAALAAATGTLGSAALHSSDFWLAFGGILACWLLNAGVAFALSYEFAVRGQGVPAGTRRHARLKRAKAVAMRLLGMRRKRHLKLVLPAREAGHEKAELRPSVRATRRNG